MCWVVVPAPCCITLDSVLLPSPELTALIEAALPSLAAAVG